MVSNSTGVYLWIKVTAFWTPTGLWQFKRLVMGTKKAATVAQDAYTHALQTKMNPESYDHIANFADDFLGGGQTLWMNCSTTSRNF